MDTELWTTLLTFGFGIVFWLVIIWLPFARLIARTGLPTKWLVLFLPPFTIVLVYIIAFSKWPKDQTGVSASHSNG
jgi:hypothetical protein